jgi:osmoprotectant transport system permease protein
MTDLFGVPLLDLLRLARAHLLLSGCAVLVAIIIGVPISIWAAQDRRARSLLLGAIGLMQTIPGLALLALFYPLLLLLGQASGMPIPALGFLPALLALSIYALLPIVRNGVAAITGIDPALLEAAKGLGMTRRQTMFHVELPLGAPVILAGIRTAAVWTIGTATLATTIGQPSLGDLIFSGLQTEDWRRVLIGCLAAAVLAILVDGLLALLESGLATRSRRKLGGGLALLIVALLAFCLPLPGQSRSAGHESQRTIIVGAKNFSEQYILAEAIETRLRAAGYRTERRDNLGSTIAYRALAAGDIDVYVDYSGTLWANVLGRKDTPSSDVMLKTLTEQLQRRDQVRLLGPLGFENAYAFAMQRDAAKKLGISSIADMARLSPQLRLASDLEFLSRPEWQAVMARYGPHFRDARSYSPTFIYRALGDGSADVISAFSSDGRIAALNLVTLTDPRGALPHYDAVLLLTARAAQDEMFVRTLQPLIGAISIDRMRTANWMVDRDADKRTPQQASLWLMAPLSKADQ